jgi:hypothetical protein
VRAAGRGVATPRASVDAVNSCRCDGIRTHVDERKIDERL